MKTYQGYIIKNYVKSPSLKCIVTEGQGGKIPNELGGLYTNETLARDDIDKYLAKKGSKNGKAKANTTSK